MFKNLKEINTKLDVFGVYTADKLWTDDYTSRQMLIYHLQEDIDVSSRNIKFINKSVDWIVHKFKLNKKSKLIDFGCGPGLYTIRFAEKGINVTGIDFSKNSLNYAKKKAKEKNFNINYINTNYLYFKTLEKFDLITMIMCDFCALSPDQRRQLLNIFKNILKPDGHILIDIYTLKAFNNKEETSLYELNQLNKFWAENDYYCFLNSFKYEKEKVSLDKYTIIEKNRTRVVYNWLQYFSEESIKKEFLKSGLSIEKLYLNVAGDDYKKDSLEMAIAAKLYNTNL